MLGKSVNNILSLFSKEQTATVCMTLWFGRLYQMFVDLGQCLCALRGPCVVDRKLKKKKFL